jgi:hypothetical protein
MLRFPARSMKPPVNCSPSSALYLLGALTNVRSRENEQKDSARAEYFSVWTHGDIDPKEISWIPPRYSVGK